MTVFVSGGKILAGGSGVFSAGGTTDITTLSLSSPNTQSNAAFTVGQAFRRGDIPSGSFITANITNFQSDVKNLWSDGSVKFAVLSGSVNTVANTPLNVTVQRTGTSPGGTVPTLASLRAALTSGQVVFSAGITATVDLPTVIAGTPFRSSYNSGAQMSEWHWRAPAGSDPFLECWFFVRYYAGGQIEIELGVENGHLNTASPVTKSYTATVTYNSSQRYTGALTHYYQSRWSRVDWYGTDPQVTPAHNAAYLQSTLVVPNYSFTGITSTDLNSYTTTYTPLSLPNLPTAMGNTGAQDFIGLLMNWDAAYLTSSGDPRAYNAVIATARGLGTYQTHFRDETTNLPLAFSSYPHLVINQNANNVGANAPSSTSSYTPQGSGTQSIGTWDFPHAPAAGTMAYLLTGRRLFIDELQFVTTCHFLCNGDSVRQGSAGVFDSTSAGTVRGAAWNLRTLSHNCVLTPDGEGLRTEFQNSWASNMDFYTKVYVYGTLGLNGAATGTMMNTLGAVLSYQTNGQNVSEYNPGSGQLWMAAWMQAFMGASIGYAWDLEPTTDITSRQKHQDFRDFLYRHSVGLFGDDSGFNYRRCCPYAMVYTTTENSNPIAWQPSWAAVKTQYESAITGSPGNNRSSLSTITGTGTIKQHDTDTDLTNNDSSTFPEGFISNQVPALAYAVQHGAPGAAVGLARMQASSSYSFSSACNNIPVWGTLPRNDIASWYSAITPGTWAVAPGGSLLSSGQKWDPASPAGQGIGSADSMTPWSSGILNRKGLYLDSTFIWGDHICFFGGGHGDYGGNEVYGYGPLNSLTVQPSWKRLTDPTLPPPTDTARDGSGNPVSRHDYDQIIWHPLTNSLVACVLGAEFEAGGSSAGQSDEFNFNLPNIRSGGAWTQIPSSISVGVQPYGPSFYDPNTDILYFLVSGQGIQPQPLITCDLTRNKATGWTSVGGKNNAFGNNSTGAFDPVRRIACIAGADQNGFVFMDFRNPSSNDWYIPTTTGASLPAVSADVAVIHDDINDRFVIFIRPTGNLLYVSPPFASPYQSGNAWTVTSVTPSGLTPPPDVGGGGGGHPIFHKVQAERVPHAGYFVCAAPSDSAGGQTGSGSMYIYRP